MDENKSYIFKINKIDKLLARLIRKTKEERRGTNNQHQDWNGLTKQIQDFRVIRKYYEITSHQCIQQPIWNGLIPQKKQTTKTH